MDLIRIIESTELPEIDKDPQEEEDQADFINIFYFRKSRLFKECPIILSLIWTKNLKSTSDFQNC